MRFQLPSIEESTPRAPRLWLVATVALFLDVHVGTDLVAQALGVSIGPVAIARACAFYVLAAVVVWPFLRGLASAVKDPAAEALVRRSLVLSLPTFGAASALVFPYRGDDGYVSLAVLYARMSTAPFAQHSGWFHKRLLLPAIAWALPTEPEAYWTLSLFIAFFGVLALVVMTESWLERAGVATDRPLSRLPIHVALATVNPIIFSFQAPGYPDLLGLGILWLAMAFSPGPQARASAIAIAVIAHEGVFFAALPLVLVGGSSRERRLVLAVTAAYGLGWAASASAAVHAVITQQLRPSEMPSWDWLAAYPGRAVLGVLAAFKALWLVVLAVLFAAWHGRERRFALSVAVVVFAPLVVLPLAVDTSRIVGFGVAGVVACLAFVLGRAASSRAWLRFGWSVVALTIVVPSTYVALNTGEIVVNGLYALVRKGTIFVE